MMTTSARIDRASPTDLMMLATDVGPAPMQVGAVITFDASAPVDLSLVEELIATRIHAVPRLRQRLVTAPIGCGRAVWVDDTEFDIGSHLKRVSCPPPYDEDALLELAADLVGRPLPRSRPLWSAALVTGSAGGAVALVIVMHHVLADGIGGLAILAGLVDGASGPLPAAFPNPGPSRRALAVDAWAERLHAVARLRRGWRAGREGAAELGVRRVTRAARCSLNRPTGPRRRLAVVRVGLADVRAVAHRHGGTVNDVVLTTVTGALNAFLATRGEHVDTLVVSVPVSSRGATTRDRLGNSAGVMPVGLPTSGERVRRLERIASITRSRKTSARGASAAVLGLAFRGIAGLGLFHWFVDHQRLVHTFVTNLRGPDRSLTLGRARIGSVIPITITAGNVTVAFAALSHAGTLTITVVADPDRVPDLAVLRAALRAEVSALVAEPRSPAGPVGRAERDLRL